MSADCNAATTAVADAHELEKTENLERAESACSENENNDCNIENDIKHNNICSNESQNCDSSVNEQNQLQASEQNQNTSLSSESTSTSEGHINEDARRTSYDEVDELFDKVLNALGQLKQLEQRNRLIAEREVVNLRAAYNFTVEEEKTVLAEMNAHPEQLHKLHKLHYKPFHKAKVANRLLCSLEEYVQCKPAAKSFEYNSYNDNSSNSNKNKNSNDANKSINGGDDNKVKPAILTNKTTSYTKPNSFISWKSVFHTPSERRIQIFVVFLFLFFTTIPISLGVTLFLLFYNKYTSVCMWGYLIYLITWGRTLHHPFHKSTWVTRWRLWRYYTDYFPIRLVIPRYVRRKFDPQRNYFFVYHPHGIHTFGAMICFNTDATELSRMLPGIHTHLQTLRANFYVPFWRTLVILLGCGDASAECIHRTLRAGPGESVVVVVGGVEEALLTRPHSNDIVLQKRKGFIRIALQEGTPLVPVYGFGENNVYTVPHAATTNAVQRYYAITKRWLGFAIPLFGGRGFFNFRFGVLPHRQPIVVVVGSPLRCLRLNSQPKKTWKGDMRCTLHSYASCTTNTVVFTIWSLLDFASCIKQREYICYHLLKKYVVNKYTHVFQSVYVYITVTI